MRPLFRLLSVAACLALAACNGTALVTLTATPATVTSFLAYRVRLVSVELQDSSGATQSVLPSALSVDLTQLGSLSEVIGIATVRKAHYTAVTVSIDYTGATIVGDDGSLGGVALKPVDAGGQPLGQVSTTLQLDPSSTLHIGTGSASQLYLDFRLSASNDVDLTAGTVTVTPVLMASAQAIDSKTVRVRGPLGTVDTTNSDFAASVEPFDGLVSGDGALQVVPTATTVYEIDGVAYTGSSGFSTLAGLPSGAWTVSYGTLSATTSTATSGSSTSTSTTSTTTSTGTTTASTATTTVETSITFTPTQVLANGSVQGAGRDLVTGVVTARSGDTLTVPTATWISGGGVPTFVSGIATVQVGGNTAVTTIGQGAAISTNSAQQVSVGSVIEAFGSASGSATSLNLDATAGRVRIDNTVVSGTLTNLGTGQLTVDLGSLAGRNPAPFDFAGTAPANPTAYVINTNGLDQSALQANLPVLATGQVAPFGTPSPDFNVSSTVGGAALEGAGSINAELVLDWAGAGSTTPFATLSGTELDMPVTGAIVGLRHQVATGGAVPLDVTQLGSDLFVIPSSGSAQVYAIAHRKSSRVESFDSFTGFVAALQAELNGAAAALTVTAEGTFSGDTLTATSLTLSLND